MKLLKKICLLVTCFVIQSQGFEQNNSWGHRYGPKGRSPRPNSVRIPFLGHKISFSIPSLEETHELTEKNEETSLSNRNDDDIIVFATDKISEQTTEVWKNEEDSTTTESIMKAINPENSTSAVIKDKEVNLLENDTAILKIVTPNLLLNGSSVHENNVTDTLLNKTDKPNLNSRFGVEEADYLLVPVGTLQEQPIHNTPVTSGNTGQPSSYRVVTPTAGAVNNGYQGSFDNIRFPDSNSQIFTPVNQALPNQATGSSNIIFPLANSNYINNGQSPTGSTSGQYPLQVISNSGFNNNVQSPSPQYNLGNQFQTVVPQNNLIPVNFNNQANVPVPNSAGYNTIGLINSNSVPNNNYINSNYVPQNQVYTQANVMPGYAQNNPNNVSPVNNNNLQYYTLVNVPNNLNGVQNNAPPNVYFVNPNQGAGGQQFNNQPYNVVSLSNPNYVVTAVQGANMQNNQIPINNNNLGAVVFPQNRNIMILPQNQATNVPFGNNQQVMYAVNSG